MAKSDVGDTPKGDATDYENADAEVRVVFAEGKWTWERWEDGNMVSNSGETFETDVAALGNAGLVNTDLDVQGAPNPEGPPPQVVTDNAEDLNLPGPQQEHVEHRD